MLNMFKCHQLLSNSNYAHTHPIIQ